MRADGTAGFGARRLAILLLIALPAVLLAFHPIDSADIWFHLATGDLIAGTGAIPRSDPFSATPPATWIVHDWLAAFLLSSVHRAGGGRALVLLATLVTVSALALPLGLAACRRAVLWPFMAALLLATGVAYERFFVRPEMFTLLAASIWVCALAAGAPRSWRSLALLALVQALWVNLHAAFVLGPFLAALAVAGQMGDAALGRGAEARTPGAGARQRLAALPRPRLVLPFVAALACCVNPYGPQLIGHILRASRELGATRLGAGIVEWQPTFSRPIAGDLVLMLFVTSLALTVAAAIAGRRTVRTSELLVVVAMAALAVGSRRHLALDVIVALPLAARWIARRRASSTTTAAPRLLPRLAVALLPALALVVAVDVARGSFYTRFGPPRSLGWGFSESDHPIGAGEFVVRHGLDGPMFNNVAAGSYLVWRLRGKPPVLLDGRLLDPDLFAAYRRCLEAPAEFEALARTRRFQLVVLALQPFPPARLFRHLMVSPEWGLVYFDGEGAVFVRGTVFERAQLERLSLDAALPTESAPTGRRGGWLGGCDPGAALRRGRMLLQLGYPQAARADLARARLHCPERWDVGLALGTALVATGRAAEAEPLVARALAHVGSDSGTWTTYGLCRAALGDTAGARAAWERARALEPADPRPAELLRELGR